MHARGIEHHTNGVNNVLSYINLVLATGKIGAPGRGYGTITGQGNGQGGREHGLPVRHVHGLHLPTRQRDRLLAAPRDTSILYLPRTRRLDRHFAWIAGLSDEKRPRASQGWGISIHVIALPVRPD